MVAYALAFLLIALGLLVVHTWREYKKIIDLAADYVEFLEDELGDTTHTAYWDKFCHEVLKKALDNDA